MSIIRILLFYLCISISAVAQPLVALSLSSLAQRAFDDTVSWFWFQGTNTGTFDTLATTFQPSTSIITNITQANPAVVTTSFDNGYQTGQTVWITNETGMSQINGGPYTITVLTNTTFALTGINSTNYTPSLGGSTASVIYASPPAAEWTILNPGGGYLADRMWTTSQSINVAYSWWKTSGSPVAYQKLQQQWAWVNATYTVTQMQQCQASATAAAQDDAAWTTGGLLMLYEATLDPTALTYAKGMLDCAWTRWADNALGGGLWYDDTKTGKTAYQVQYAVDLIQYYNDTVSAGASDTSYLIKAEQEEVWLTAALFRNGQAVSAQAISLVTVNLPYGASITTGNTASVTLTCTCISGSPVTLTYTETGSDTIATIAASLVTLINTTPAIVTSGISAVAPGPTISIFTPVGKYLTVTAVGTPTTGSIVLTSSTVGLPAGSYTYPTDGLLWMDTQPNGTAPYGISQSTNQPYGIYEAGSVTMLEANMAYAVLESRLYAITGNTAYLTRLNQVATGMRSHEMVSSTNIVLNDRDASDNAFAVYYYAHEVIPRLTGTAGTQLDKTSLVTTAWAAALNARCANGTYGGSWEGPCQGLWFKAHQGGSNFEIAVSAQAAAMIVAGYYASLH